MALGDTGGSVVTVSEPRRLACRDPLASLSLLRASCAPSAPDSPALRTADAPTVTDPATLSAAAICATCGVSVCSVPLVEWLLYPALCLVPFGVFFGIAPAAACSELAVSDTELGSASGRTGSVFGCEFRSAPVCGEGGADSSPLETSGFSEAAEGVSLCDVVTPELD